MKNVMYVFLLVLAMSICAAPGMAETNLIANPSFETPQIGSGGIYTGLWQAPDGWTAKVANTIFWTYSPPAPVHPDGTQSVIMWDAMWQNTGVQFQAGYTYTFSVYTSDWHLGSGAYWFGIGDPYVNGGVNDWYGGAEIRYGDGSDPSWIKHTASRTVSAGDPMIGRDIVFQLGSDFGGGFDLVELYATANPQVAAPVFTPPGGEYVDPIDVSISCATAGATIYYTTDGSTPDQSSTLYSGTPIPVSSDTVPKARAFKDGMVPSNVAAAVYIYTLNGPNLAANPSFETPTLGGGVWQAPNDWNGKVAGTIYWNLHVPAADGTQSLLLWDAIWQNTGVQFQGGYTYTLSVYTSTWHDGSGWFWWGIGDPAVNGGVNDWYGGAELLAGSGADPNWYKRTTTRTVPVDDPVVGKDIVLQLGSDYGGGLDMVELYATPPGPTTNRIANPSFEMPSVGTPGGASTGVWQAPTGWSTSEPSSIFQLCNLINRTPPGIAEPDGTQSVIMWTAMWQNTGVQFQEGYTYTFSVYTSTWHDGEGWFWWGIGDPAANGINEWYGGAEVIWGTGSDPNWYKHTATRTVPPGDPMIGRDIVFQLGSSYGGGFDMVELYVTEPVPQVETPTFTPPAGGYVNPINVSISCATAGATIYYTTNGFTPDESSALYSGTPIPVSSDTTLKAKAFKDGMAPSNVGTAVYTYTLNRPNTIPYGNAITIDGNLSDWAGAEWAPLDRVYDGSPMDIAEAYYAAKWEEEKVYVAVKVRDIAHWFTDGYTAWNARDAVELYIRTTAPSGPYPDQHSAQEWTTGFNVGGSGLWRVVGDNNPFPAGSFDSAGTIGVPTADWLNYEAAITPYEYFDMNGVGLVVSPLSAGMVIGLDAVAAGHDGSDYTGMKSENDLAGKFADSAKFGTHLLVIGMDIGGAKKSADGTGGEVSGIVSAVFTDFFYIESADREYGIRVEKASHGLSVGQAVTVGGTVGTLASGERYILAVVVSANGSGSIKPLGVTNKALGGGDYGTAPNYQVGVDGGVGLNNIGLLIRTTGSVGATGSGWFMIGDGSGVSVKVIGTLPPGATYVTVTGISSCENDGGVKRAVLAVSVDKNLP